MRSRLAAAQQLATKASSSQIVTGRPGHLHPCFQAQDSRNETLKQADGPLGATYPGPGISGNCSPELDVRLRCGAVNHDTSLCFTAHLDHSRTTHQLWVLRNFAMTDLNQHHKDFEQDVVGQELKQTDNPNTEKFHQSWQPHLPAANWLSQSAWLTFDRVESKIS